MQKYNYSLDLNSQNSNSLIVKHITAGTEILEFGPAFGRLTRYLQVELDCTVDIVELDEESGNAAAAFARKACIGEKKGNIENYFWESYLSQQTYDYIIFADVLEHLHHPETVLEKCRKFLKKNGQILCAVPNIAHSSIIISLWNNDFNYNDVGLLDNTHIHFFTRKSFAKMAVRSGYHVLSIEEVDSPVGTNEIPWSYDSVPLHVSTELKFRPDGEAYEYVFCLKDDADSRATEYYNYGNSKAIECICYIKENNNPDFSQNKCIKKYLSEKKNDIYFDLSVFENIIGLCVQIVPLNQTIIKLNCCEINGVKVPYVFSGIEIENNVLVFENNSDIFVNLTAGEPRILHLSFEIISFSDTKYITDCITKIKQLECQNQECIEQIHDLKKDISLKETLQDERENALTAYKNQIQEKEEKVQGLTSQLEQLQIIFQEQKNTIQNLRDFNSEKDATIEVQISELRVAETRLVSATEKIKAQLLYIDELEGLLKTIKQSWVGKFLNLKNTNGNLDEE